MSPNIQDQSPTVALYNFFQKAFDFYNQRLFQGQIPYALIVLSRRINVLGHYSPKKFVPSDYEGRTDEIALNPEYMGTRAIEHTLSTLVHEMCHSHVYNNIKHTVSKYHCQVFRDVMLSLGLQTSSTGRPGGKQCGYRMTHYIIEGGEFETCTIEFLSSELVKIWFDNANQLQEIVFEKNLPKDDENANGEGKSNSKTDRNSPGRPRSGLSKYQKNDVDTQILNHQGGFFGLVDSKVVYVTTEEGFNYDDASIQSAPTYRIYPFTHPDHDLKTIVSGENSILTNQEASKITFISRTDLNQSGKNLGRIQYSCRCEASTLGRCGLRLRCLICDEELKAQVPNIDVYQAFCKNMELKKHKAKD